MKDPIVIVANAFRQHTHQLAYALIEKNLLKLFFTGFWYKEHSFPYFFIKYLPKKLSNVFKKELLKRYFKKIPENYVRQIPYPEIKYRFFMPWIKNKHFHINKEFANYVAKKITKLDFDILISYELCSLEAFKLCKRMNKICIYDLASVAYNFQYEAFLKYKNIYINDELEEIIKRKSEEIKLADFILVPSNIVAESLLALGVNSNKIEKIPYGIDFSIFKPKENYKISNKLKILFVGHLQLYKGIEILLESIKELRDYDIELTLIGKIGDAKDILNKYKGMYRHIPFVNQNFLQGYYQASDILILPSLIEGYGQIVIESMACGTPVVVSDRSGSSNVVRNGIDGFVVPAGDKNALIEKILFFLNNKDKIEMMGKNASMQAKQYSWEKYRERIRDFIIRIWRERQNLKSNQLQQR